MRLLRVDGFMVVDEGVLCSTPGPTEAGRFSSWGVGSVVCDGSVGDRTVGRACIACAYANQ
jgi:hypothetical protein